MHETPATPPTAPATPAGPSTKRRRALLIALIAAVVVLFALSSALTLALFAANDNSTPAPVSATTSPAAPAAAAATTKAAPRPTLTPSPSDFQLTVKVIEQECFGSAGCIVTFRLDIAYTGPRLPTGVTYEVVYEVRGGEEPLINNFTIQGDIATQDREQTISTTSSKAKLTAVVTDVSVLG
jgi:hypothetical protein